MIRKEEIQRVADKSARENEWYPGETSYESFVRAFEAGAKWADKNPTKSEDNVMLSFHVCNVPCPEEVMAGANAEYEAFFVSVPKNLLPQRLLEVITKNSKISYISQVALLKDGLI